MRLIADEPCRIIELGNRRIPYGGELSLIAGSGGWRRYQYDARDKVPALFFLRVVADAEKDSERA